MNVDQNIDQIVDFDIPHSETVGHWAPPAAPLAMPRQVLEQPARRSFAGQLAMLLFPRERT